MKPLSALIMYGTGLALAGLGAYIDRVFLFVGWGLFLGLAVIGLALRIDE